jgi:peptidoglycan-N-acetylglucosamine deacetylase
MRLANKIACWASFVFLLAVPSTTEQADYSPAPELPSPLRLAFMDSTSPEARIALEKHIDDLDGVIGEWLNVDADGKVSAEEDPDQDDASPLATIDLIRSTRPLTILALVSDDPGSDRAFARLGDPQFRFRLEQQLLVSVKKYGFDGLLINFENLRNVDEAGLRSLISELRPSLTAANRKIGVVLPGNQYLDYKALGALADLAVIELYDDTQPIGGPLSADPWWRRVIAERSKDIPAEKLVFAVASMGREWTSPIAADGESQFVSFAAVMLAAASQHVPVQFDPVSRNPHIRYTGGEGTEHDIWFLDAATAFNQVSGAVAELPRGVALRELGAEDDSLWSFFKKIGTGVALDPAAIEQVKCDSIAMRAGQGEVYRFKNAASEGRRSVQLSDTGEIAYESYEILPRPWELEVTGVQPGSVVLSFDDGPDPEYTPEILDILKQEDVKAIFFVTGFQSISHPDIVRRMAREGHEVGNHSFTHPDLSKLPDFLVRLELNSTQRVIQVLAGKPPRLIRPPYAADNMGYTPQEAHVLEIATGLGYRALGANLNPEDWRGIPAAKIVETVLREADNGNGSVIELHDAGGDRSQTVKALPILIEALRDRGFKFVRPSEFAGAAGEPVTQPTDDPWLKVATYATEGILVTSKFFWTLYWTCLALSSLRFFLLLVSALRSRRSGKSAPVYEPPVSALIPAYNEEKVIVRTIQGVLNSDYPALVEIIVVDDGSTDATASVVEQAFKDEPRVRLFRVPNRGKAEALNYGLSRMQTEIAVMLDADTQLHSGAVRFLARHFIDPKIGAVAGNAKVGNRKNLLTNLQALEYITAQNLERAGLAQLNAMAVVPGAIGAWRREALLEAGGFSPTTLAEDCDLTFALHRLGYKIVHDMSAVAWTEAPENWRAFARQRFRWTFGTLQAAYRHSDALVSGRLDGFNLLTLPSVLLFGVILPLIGPVLDFLLSITVCTAIAGLYMHPEAFDLQPALWVVGSYTFVFLIELSAALLAFALEPNEQKTLLWCLPVQRICYRQVMYVIMIQAMLACLRGDAQGWNKLKRVGSVTGDAVPGLPS